MKRFKNVTIAFAIAFSALLSGCYPTGEISRVNSRGDSESTTGSSSQAPKTVENLTVTATLPEYTQSEANQIVLTYRKWDNDKVLETLLVNDSIIKEQHTPSDVFEGEDILVYDTENDCRIVLETGRITYYNKSFMGRTNFTAFFLFELKKASEELSDFPKSKAIEMAEDYLKRFNINNCGEPKVTAIFCEEANEQLKSFPESVDEWTKDDEIYILEFPLEYDNIPISSASEQILGTDKHSPGTFIEMAVSREGVVMIKSWGIMAEECQKVGSVKIEFDAKAALEALVSNYSKGKLLDLTEIRSCRLVYFPVAVDGNVYTYSPFWEFEIITTTEYGVYSETKLMNAQTGIFLGNYW